MTDSICFETAIKRLNAADYIPRRNRSLNGLN